MLFGTALMRCESERQQPFLPACVLVERHDNCAQG